MSNNKRQPMLVVHFEPESTTAPPACFISSEVSPHKHKKAKKRKGRNNQINPTLAVVHCPPMSEAKLTVQNATPHTSGWMALFHSAQWHTTNCLIPSKFLWTKYLGCDFFLFKRNHPRDHKIKQQ